MKLLDLTLKTPEENLACDEALLDLCEENQGLEILRFWESDVYFAVAGYSNKVRVETHFENCLQDKVPVLRRASGGGTVLQGPGCLNYSLVLRIPEKGPLTNLTQTNDYVLNKHKQALAPLLSGNTSVFGISDLALGNLKFSGNAQRRKKNALLFHGTFLYAFDLAKIERYLAFPSKQPDYRENREHLKFITNVPLKPAQIKMSLVEIWKAEEAFKTVPGKETSKLVEEKYSREDWNLKY